MSVTESAAKAGTKSRQTWKVVGGTLVLVAGAALAFRSQVGSHAANAQAPARPTAKPAAATTNAGKPAAPKTSNVATGARPVATANGPQQVMAVVNGQAITRQELGQETVRRYGKEVLEAMVNRQLIEEACAEQGVKITEKDVDAEVDRVASKFGLSRDRWLALLKEERGFGEQQYRKEVIWPMLALKQIAAQQVKVTPDELKMAFESEYGPKVRARLIVVSSEQKAKELQKQAVADPDSFGELAKLHCEDTAVASALGVIPPIRKHSGSPEIEKAAFSLQPGEISPVVKVANQYFVLKCEDQVAAQFVNSQNLKLVEAQLGEKIRESKLREHSGRFFAERQKAAKIENIFNDEKRQAQMPGVAAVINGKQVSLQMLQDECVTRHGAEVLEGEIHRKVLEQELGRRKLAVTEKDIDSEVSRAALTYGFITKEGKPDVDKWLAEVTSQDGATVELYVRDAVWPSVALKKLVGGQVTVSDEDLRKGFESNYGPRVEVLAIVLGNNREAQKVWEMARNNPTEAFFAQLAEQYSVEPASRANGGKVPPIRKYGGAGILEEEAFKLKQGEISGIIAVTDQFIILRCQGFTRPVKVDFEAVKEEIVKDIEEKKYRALMTKEFDRLKDKSQIDNFLKAGEPMVKSLVETASATSAPGAAGGAIAPASATAPVGQKNGVRAPAATAPRR